MATYREIAAGEVDPDSPVTSTLMVALAENPKAIAEGAADAPRNATKNQFGSAVSSGNVDFSVANMGGARFFINAYNSVGANNTIFINTSDGSFGTQQTLATVSGNSSLSGHGHIDFATGNFSIAFGSGGSTGTNSGTVTVTGSGIITLRFTAGANVTISVHNMPDGGETTT